MWVIITSLSVIEREHPEDLEGCQLQEGERDNKNPFPVRIDEMTSYSVNPSEVVENHIDEPGTQAYEERKTETKESPFPEEPMIVEEPKEDETCDTQKDDIVKIDPESRNKAQ